MGWISELARLANLSSAAAPLRSPWSSTSLTRLVLDDLAGIKGANPGRAEAMRVPAVTRGRALICGLLARHPLAVYDAAGQQLPAAAPWLTTTATPQSPRLRNLWTWDDLLFSGLSLWAVDRAPDGAILDAIRVSPALWSVDASTSRVLVNGQTASAEQVILFEGPQEGLVTLASEAITAALAMERAWSKRVQQPVPLLELHSTDATADLTAEEAGEMVDEWEKARREGGGTAYTPAGIQAIVHGTVTTDLFVAGRNAARLDFANYMSLPASLLEGSLSTASLTYSTRDGERNDLADLSLGYWALPVEARLSQDDVCAAGLNIAVDLTDLSTPAQPTRSPVQED